MMSVVTIPSYTPISSSYICAPLPRSSSVYTVLCFDIFAFILFCFFFILADLIEVTRNLKMALIYISLMATDAKHF